MPLDIETLLLFFGTVITIVTSFLSSNRGAYDRVQVMIQDATMGEVAEARHIVGTYWAWKNAHDEHGRAPEDFEFDYNENQVIDSMFKIVWALRRTQAVYKSISFLTPTPKRLLMDTLGNWVDWSVGKDGVILKLNKTLNADIGEIKHLKDLANEWDMRGNNRNH